MRESLTAPSSLYKNYSFKFFLPSHERKDYKSIYDDDDDVVLVWLKDKEAKTILFLSRNRKKIVGVTFCV